MGHAPVSARLGWGLVVLAIGAMVVALWLATRWSSPSSIVVVPAPLRLTEVAVTGSVALTPDQRLAEWQTDWERQRLGGHDWRKVNDRTLRTDADELARLAAASTWRVDRLQKLGQQVADAQGTAANLGPFYAVVLDRAELELTAIRSNPTHDTIDDDLDTAARLAAQRTLRALHWTFRPLWEDIKDPRLTQRLFALQMVWDTDEVERLWRRFQYEEFHSLQDPPDYRRATEGVLAFHAASHTMPGVVARLSSKQRADIDTGTGYLLWSQLRFAEALPFLQRAADQPETYFARPSSRYLCECLLALGRLDEAESTIASHRKRFPKDPWGQSLEDKLADLKFENEENAEAGG